MNDLSAPRRSRTNLRLLLLAVGAIVFIGGISLLSFGAWSALDGSSRADPPAVITFQDDDDAAAFLNLSTPAPRAASPTQTPQPTPPLADSAFRIVIDGIGVDAPVYTYGLDADAVPQVPTNPWDVAWYDFSAKPGTGSNAVFAGHVTWNGPAVFYDLQTMQAGDIVRLVGDNGVELSYRVSETFSVDPDDPDSLKVMYATDKDVITLITCGGTFFPTDDAVAGGDYTLRVIVRAELVGTGDPAAGGAAG